MATADRPIPLTHVRGIGPKTEAALRDIGIGGVVDLVGETPDGLSRRLASHGGQQIPAARIRSDDWIGQARRLAPTTAVPEAGPADGDPTDTEQYVATLTLRREGGHGWQAFLYDDELGHDLEVDADPDVWSRLIAERAGLSPPAGVHCGEVEVEPSGDALVIDAHLDTSGVPSNTAVFSIVALLDSESGRVTIADTRYSAAGEATSASHHQLPMPEAGHYEVESLVLLDSSPPVVERRDGPALNVVP